MKKFHTLLALAALVPMLAACAPSPEEVCQHIIDLTKKEVGEEAEAMTEQLDAHKEKCIKDGEHQKEMRGALEYNKEAKCVMAAESIADVEKCDDKDKE